MRVRPARPDLGGTPVPSLSLQPALLELERSVLEVLDSSWDEVFRRHGYEVAEAVAQGCRLEGLKEMAGLARSVAWLLGLPADVAMPLLEALREKLLELISLLKEMADAIAA